MKNQEIGQRLKQLRKQGNISQKELADLFGVVQVTISQYESGRIQLTLEMLIKYQEKFNVSFEWIVLGKSYDEKSSIDFLIRSIS